MLRKMLIKIIPFVLVSATLTGCAYRTTEPQSLVNMVKEETKQPENLSANIYYFSDDTFEILTKSVEYDKFNESFVLFELKKVNVIPESVNVNSISITEKDDIKTLTIDFNKKFVDYLNTLSADKEWAVTTSIVNTYIDYFEADRIYLTINEKPLKTNNKSYETYCIKFEGTTNPESGNFGTKTNQVDTFKKATLLFSYLDNNEGNTIVSPIMFNLELLNIYEATSNNKNIEKYLEDVNLAKTNVVNFAKDEENNFSNSLIYNDGIDQDAVFSQNYMNVINKYNTVLRGFDFSKSDAIQKINSSLNTLSFEEQSDMFESIKDDSNIFEASTFIFDKKLSFKKAAYQTGVFTDINNTEQEISYVTSVESLPYFENEQIEGFIKEYSGTNYSLIAVLPKSESVDYKKINFNELLDEYNLETKNVKISLPQISVYQKHNISSILNNFDMSDFSSLNKMFENENNCKITEIKQFNVLKLNAEAEEEENIEELTYEKEVALNRPFFYMIYNNDSNEVVLIGKINNVK